MKVCKILPILFLFSAVVGFQWQAVLTGAGVVAQAVDTYKKIEELINGPKSSDNEIKYAEIKKQLDHISESLKDYFTGDHYKSIKDKTDVFKRAKYDLERYINQSMQTNSTTKVGAYNIFRPAAESSRIALTGFADSLLLPIPGLGKVDFVQVVTDDAHCNMIEFKKKRITNRNFPRRHHRRVDVSSVRASRHRW